MAQADVLTPAGEVRTGQGTFPNTGSGEATEFVKELWAERAMLEVLDQR